MSSSDRHELCDRVEEAADLLADLARRHEPIGPRTTYRVGGSAALFVLVDTPATLERVGKAVSLSRVDTLVLGNGSNVLVSERGFCGLCVLLGESFSFVERSAELHVVRAGGATPYPVLARQTAAMGLTGMEWAVGIPGTVGGAVSMNAGGHGASTSERLINAEVVDLQSGGYRVASALELGLSYRHSNLLPSELVISASFALDSGDSATSLRAIAEIVRWRREHQPGGRNGGSVFSNPEGDTAGHLIEEAGLKGRRVGSAQVSTKHANFFLVDEGGLADDVFALIETVRGEVAMRCAIELETELRLVGFSE